AYTQSGILFILEPSTGKQEEYPNVVKFEFTKEGKHLVYQSNTKASNKLTLKNLKTGKVQEFDNIKEYSLNPTEKYLVIIQTNDGTESVKLINLLEFKQQTVLLQNLNSEYQNLTWNATGKSLAYYISEKDKNEYSI